MGGVITDRKLVVNQLGNPTARPHVTTKAEGFGPFQQQGGQLRLLLKREQWRRPGSGLVPQGLRPVQSSALEPLADRALGDAEGLGDVLLGPALLVQLPGSQAAAFAPTDGRIMLWSAHELGTKHFPAHDY